MKKMIHRFTVLMMTVCLIAGTMGVSVFAYDYQVNVSAGNGEFESGEDVTATGTDITVTAETNGTTVTAGDVSGKIVKMPDGETPANSKYFVTGIKEAGYDNDTSSTRVGGTTVKDKDVEYVVAYGLKSNMVKYRVLYRDAATGGAVTGLPEYEDFYGVAGEKPIISWKYAEGYLPQAWELTGTLNENGETEFTFWYYRVNPATGEVITIIDGVPAGAAAAAAAAAGGPAAAGVAAANIGDGQTPLANGPADTADIDNPQPPTTEPSEIDDNKTPGVGIAKMAAIGVGALLILAIAAAVLAAARRRREEEAEEE